MYQSFLQVDTSFMVGVVMYTQIASEIAEFLVGQYIKNTWLISWHIKWIKTFIKGFKILPVFNGCAEFNAFSQSIVGFFKISFMNEVWYEVGFSYADEH